MKNLKLKIFFYLFLSVPTAFSAELRNPFLPLEKHSSSNSSHDINDDRVFEEETIILKAIINSGKKSGAMLAKGFDKKLVFIDDKIWGYKVTQINSNEVSLLGEDGTSLFLS